MVCGLLRIINGPSNIPANQKKRQIRNKFVKAFLIYLILFCAAIPVQAAQPTVVAEEIQFLLNYVEKSDAVFLRNSKEYSAKEGADHLRDKLAKAGDRVKTTDDFIVGVASKSFLSGKPFLVCLPGHSAEPTGPWLSKVLAEYRLKKVEVASQ